MKKEFRIRPLFFAALMLLTSLIFVIEALGSEHQEYVFSFVGHGGTFRYHDLKILFIPAYWALMAAGFIVCLVQSLRQYKKYGIGIARAILIPVAFLIVSFAGGKLLYVIENFQSVKSSGLSFDGLSLFGAIIAVPAVALLGAKMLKMPYGALLDYCAPLGLILLIFVRIGCFISGCCGAFTIWSGTNPIILPVQLFEVVIDLVILDAVQSCEKRYEKRGVAYPLLVTLYGFARFFLEFLRKPQSESLDHSSKILAAACFFVGGAVVFLLIKRIKGERSIKNKNS